MTIGASTVRLQQQHGRRSALYDDINRILIVDDNEDIHRDIRRILLPAHRSDVTTSLDELIGKVLNETPPPDDSSGYNYSIDSAFQGDEAYALVEQSVREDRPYQVAFVDVRMPPGWDGVETVERLWQIDAKIQAVICSAYSDYTWRELNERLGGNDRFFILRKPFDAVEVQQLAEVLSTRWQVDRQNQSELETVRDQLRFLQIVVERGLATVLEYCQGLKDAGLASDDAKDMVHAIVDEAERTIELARDLRVPSQRTESDDSRYD